MPVSIPPPEKIHFEQNDDQSGYRVYLGNRGAISMVPDPTDSEEAAAAELRPIRKVPQPANGQQKNYTLVVYPRDTPIMVAAANIIGLNGEADGLWASHSTEPGPAWVASDWPMLSQLLAEHFGCEVREIELDHVASGDGDAVQQQPDADAPVQDSATATPAQRGPVTETGALNGDGLTSETQEG